MQERQVLTPPGVPMVLILLALLMVCGWWLVKSVQFLASPIPPIVLGALVVFCAFGFFIVLCGERGTQPIVNTGTLYSG